MPKLSDAVDNAFNEARMLVLGGQVLLGFSFRICFEKRFDQIAHPAQLAQMLGLGIMTAALGWLIWPAAFHQIKEKGRMTASIHSFTTTVLDWGLLPFALGLALTLYMAGDLFVVIAKVTQSAGAAGISAGLLLLAFYGLWFGVSAWRKK